jgi:orotate phosphoribosyltransferase
VTGVEQAEARRVAGALLAAGVLGVTPDAPVTFASGLRSPVYVDGRRLPFHPPAWRTVIEACAARVGRERISPQVISGVEAAGIPHSSALAWRLELPCVFVRKQPKEHGLGRRVEGGDIGGLRVLLVEDMVTTGGSSLSAIEALRADGARADDCLAIVSYAFAEAFERFASAGVRLHVMARVEDLVREAHASGLIGDAEMSAVDDWLADPGGWHAG